MFITQIRLSDLVCNKFKNKSNQICFHIKNEVEVFFRKKAQDERESTKKIIEGNFKELNERLQELKN